MKPWMVAVLAFIPFGVIVIAAIYWRRRWLDEQQRAIDALIVPPVPKFGATTEREREAIRADALRRSRAAEDKRRDANRIRSGEPVEDRIRIVRK